VLRTTAGEKENVEAKGTKSGTSGGESFSVFPIASHLLLMICRERFGWHV
jgi:hypothetical protein